MQVQQAYKEKLAAQLKEWNAEIALLEAKVEKAGADMKVKGAEQLQELHTQQHAAIEKMKELEKASGEAWDQVKQAADKMWADMKAGVANAQSKFH